MRWVILLLFLQAQSTASVGFVELDVIIPYNLGTYKYGIIFSSPINYLSLYTICNPLFQITIVLSSILLYQVCLGLGKITLRLRYLNSKCI